MQFQITTPNPNPNPTLPPLPPPRITITDECYVAKHPYQNPNQKSNPKPNPKPNHKPKHSIFFSYANEPLIKSIVSQEILPKCSQTNYNVIKFNADKVERLIDYRNTNPNTTTQLENAVQLLYDLSSQLNYLMRRYGKCFLGYYSTNVLVISHEGVRRFVYIPKSEDICDIVDNTLRVSHPFTRHKLYESPETLTIKRIPSFINPKSIYYSLGCLVLDGLRFANGNRFMLKHACIDETCYEDYIERNLKLLEDSFLKGSKLYYCLKRCLQKEADDRSCIYI